MTDYDPRPLTDAELLAWAVIIEYRDRRMRDAAAILLPYPCCPTCLNRVIKVEVLPTRPATLTQPIVIHPCGHGYLADDGAQDRVRRHAEAMLDILDSVALGEAGQPWWNTDGIIREARLRVAVPEQAATEATEPEHVCKPGATTYFCPASGEMESDCHGGFDQCCDRPDLHRPTAETGPCPACRRADQAGLAPSELHAECVSEETP